MRNVRRGPRCCLPGKKLRMARSLKTFRSRRPRYSGRTSPKISMSIRPKLVSCGPIQCPARPFERPLIGRLVAPRPSTPRKQAGQMTAPDRSSARLNFPLAAQGPSTDDSTLARGSKCPLGDLRSASLRASCNSPCTGRMNYFATIDSSRLDDVAIAIGLA